MVCFLSIISPCLSVSLWWSSSFCIWCGNAHWWCIRWYLWQWEGLCVVPNWADSYYNLDLKISTWKLKMHRMNSKRNLPTRNEARFTWVRGTDTLGSWCCLSAHYVSPQFQLFTHFLWGPTDTGFLRVIKNQKNYLYLLFAKCFQKSHMPS